MVTHQGNGAALEAIPAWPVVRSTHPLFPAERLPLIYPENDPMLSSLAETLKTNASVFFSMAKGVHADPVGVEAKIEKISGGEVIFRGVRRVMATFQKEKGQPRAIAATFPVLDGDKKARKELLDRILSEIRHDAVKKGQDVAAVDAQHEKYLLRLMLAPADQVVGFLTQILPTGVLTPEQKQDILCARSLMAQLGQLQSLCETIYDEALLPEEEKTEVSVAEEPHLATRIRKAKLPKHVREEADRELKKLENLPKGQSEAAAVEKWLEDVLRLPQASVAPAVYTQEDYDGARRILDKHHFGMEDLKAQVMRQMAVLMRPGEGRTAKPLLLVGPPGVGKTTIARSIAAVLQRKFVRVPLSSVKDESELRGHGRTYLAARYGKFAEAMIAAKCQDPVMLLDEVDKMASSRSDDPASILLGALDPEQNDKFSDK